MLDTRVEISASMSSRSKVIAGLMAKDMLSNLEFYHSLKRDRHPAKSGPAIRVLVIGTVLINTCFDISWISESRSASWSQIAICDEC